MSDRKYRHRGYQDDGDRDRPRRGTGRGPRPPGGDRPGPRGRGLGKPTANVFRCAVCGTGQQSADVALDAVCAKCQAELHTCTHCTHFDTSVRWECRQPIEVRVTTKAKRNGCTHFAAKTTQEFAREVRAPSTVVDARSAFDALFNK